MDPGAWVKRSVRVAGGGVCALLLGLACAGAVSAPGLTAGMPKALMQELDGITSLAQARQRLWQLREAGSIDQGGYLLLARHMEPRLRSDELQKLMDELGVKHTGRPPLRGGGILSDIDGSAPTEAAYQEFMRRLKKLDPDLQVDGEQALGARAFDRFSFRSQKYDVVGWRPRSNLPSGSGYAAQVEQGTAQALNNELALGARPGATAHPQESNLENLSKGAEQMFNRPKPGFEGEADLVAAGKDVLRSMKASGQCQKSPAVCGWLNDLRSRAKSPKELGYADPIKLQERLSELMGQSYRAADAQFATEYKDLLAQLRKAGTGPERDRLIQLADEMAERATRMGARYEALQRQYPDKMKQFVGSKSPSEFWREQNERIRELQKGQQVARDNVTIAHQLNILLNLAEFARCMQEETTGAADARRAQALLCLQRAVAGYLVGQAAQTVIGKAINLITVVLPNGVKIAQAVPQVMLGVVSVQTGLQLMDAGFELWQKGLAEAQADSLEDALAKAQQLNLAEFPRRLAAEEAVVAAALREIAVRQKALVDDLALLGRELSALLDKTQLRQRRARLEALLPGIKARAETCWKRLGESARGITDPTDRVREGLTQASRLVRACHERSDVDRAQAAYREVERDLDAWRALATGAGASAAPVDKRAADRDLAEAQRLMLALEQVAAPARANLRELAGFRDRVQAVNELNERQQQQLAARLEALLQSVPPAMVQMLNQSSSRIEDLRRKIGAVAALPNDAWVAAWQASVKRDAPLRELVDYMDDGAGRVQRVLEEAEDCRQRSGGGAAIALQERAESAWDDLSISYRNERASCLLRLDALDAQQRWQQRLAQEEAALKAQADSARAARDDASSRFEAALKSAQGAVAQREAKTPPGVAGAINRLTAELGGATELCAQGQSARQKLTDTLRSMESDGQQLEATLTHAQQLAASCQDRATVERAQRGLLEADGLQTRIDQRLAALPLLALQVDDLGARRNTLQKHRTEANAALAATSAVPAPIDFGLLQSALDEMRGRGQAWAAQAAEQQRQRLAKLQADFAQLPAATLALGIARLRTLAQNSAVPAWTDSDLQQRAGSVAALRERAAAHSRGAQPAAADKRNLQTMLQAAACLDTAMPNISAGINQADTLRSVAQLATQKLGGPVRARLASCSERLAKDLSNADKQARVAAKTCNYQGSEPVWDEREYRPMCRCLSGRSWNAGQTACVATRETQLANANCSSFANTAPRWNDEQAKVVCSCVSGYRYSAPTQTCEADPQTLVTRMDCSRFPHAEAYWDSAQLKASCRCQAGYPLNAQRKTCEARSAASPQALPPRGRYAGWVGHWTCQMKIQAQVKAETLKKAFPERLSFDFAEDGRGGLKASDGGPWGPVDLTDDTHFSMPLPMPGAKPLVFELRGNQIVGQSRMPVEGVMAYLSMTCLR